MLTSSTLRPPVGLKPFQEQARSGRARRRHLHGDEVHGGEEEELAPKILSIGMILLNVTSRGFAHIQVKMGKGREGWGVLLTLMCPKVENIEIN